MHFRVTLDEPSLYFLLWKISHSHIKRGSERTNKIWVKILIDHSPAALPNNEGWIKIIDEFTDFYGYIKNDGNIFYFLTTENSPRRQIIKIDIETMEKSVLIPETENVLDGGIVVNKKYLLIEYMVDVKSTLKLHRLEDGSFVKNISLDIGSLAGLTYHRKGLRKKSLMNHIHKRAIFF